MAYDPSVGLSDLGIHWELSKYLYSAICRLEVQIMEIYGSSDIDTIFLKTKFRKGRLFHEIREIIILVVKYKRFTVTPASSNVC